MKKYDDEFLEEVYEKYVKGTIRRDLFRISVNRIWWENFSYIASFFEAIVLCLSLTLSTLGYYQATSITLGVLTAIKLFVTFSSKLDTEFTAKYNKYLSELGFSQRILNNSIQADLENNINTQTDNKENTYKL